MARSHVSPWVPSGVWVLTRPQQLVLEVIATHGHSWQSNRTHLGLNLVNSQPTAALIVRGLVQYKRTVQGLKQRNWEPITDPDSGARVRGAGQYAVELTPAGTDLWAAAQ